MHARCSQLVVVHRRTLYQTFLNPERILKIFIFTVRNPQILKRQLFHVLRNLIFMCHADHSKTIRPVTRPVM
uniref:Uncharacterized protein n=1 Tax=uncultured marine virus TaxID=186617 RepID=A0A0F7L3V9_9VIRU|nr:hypothetical protein [uncultured marine virus]